MASSDHVGRVLRNVLSLSVTSVATLAPTCGGIDTDGFDAVACGSDARTQYLPGLKPAAPADYLELRQLTDVAAGQSEMIESFGDRCVQAADKPQCEAAVAAATSNQGFFLGNCVDFCPSMFLIVNAGDDVTVVDTEAGLKSWILPVDAPQDAVLIASLSGYEVVCENTERGGVRRAGDAYEVLASRLTAVCDPIERTLYILRVSAAGEIEEVDSEVVESESGVCIGRRPAGLARARSAGSTKVGAYFADVAHLEAASVHAFEVLRDELAHHGAPGSLIEQATAARQDEVRHARVMRRVAERHGGVVRAPRVERGPLRSLEEIALENAAEGCIRETFGALVGMWQARFARDLVVRRVMRGVARDETRHASLAWAIDAWIRPRLSPAERRRVEEARRGALDALAEERPSHDRELIAWAGLPGPAAGRRLARHFAQSVDALARPT